MMVRGKETFVMHKMTPREEEEVDAYIADLADHINAMGRDLERTDLSEVQRNALDTRRTLLLQVQKDMNTLKTEQRERRSRRSKPSPGPNANI